MKKIIIGIVALLIIGLCIFFAINHNNKGINNNNNNKSSNSSKTNSKTTEEVKWDNYDSNDITLSKSIKITEGGVYNLTGTIDDGYILIDTEDEVKLVLNNVNIKNSNGPAILVTSAKLVEIELAEGTENYLEDSDNYSTDNQDYDAVIYSKDDLIISGTGSLTIKANLAKGIVSKDNLTIEDGEYKIEAVDDGINVNDIITINSGTFNIISKDDGIHADGMLEINGGTFNIESAEGLEATYVKINDGNITINASDDGINAANKSEDYTICVEINGGNITIKMGQGDTDGIDSNGDIIINGGVIDVTGQSAFDYDGKAEHNGGTIIVNGSEVDTISNQFMGDGGAPGGNMQPPEGEMPNGNMQPPEGEMPNGDMQQPPRGGRQNR